MGFQEIFFMPIVAETCVFLACVAPAAGQKNTSLSSNRHKKDFLELQKFSWYLENFPGTSLFSGFQEMFYAITFLASMVPEI